MKRHEEKSILSQIGSIEVLFQQLDGKKQHYDFSGSNITDDEVTQFNSACLALIERATGANHAYYKQAIALLGDSSGASWNGNIPKVYGIVKSVKHDLENDYLTGVREIVHAELFSDFIEMADYLLSEDLKDAAAVLLGGVLETHIRKLAENNEIDLSTNGKQKRTEKLNEELGKVAYGLLEQKTITAWLDLRNKAAHAHYDSYNKDQVALLSQGLKNFIINNPA